MMYGAVCCGRIACFKDLMYGALHVVVALTCLWKETSTRGWRRMNPALRPFPCEPVPAAALLAGHEGLA